MPIDVDAALGAAAQISEISWTPTDVVLYHLSIGAGSRPGHPELTLTFERDLSVLPTFGLVAGSGPSSAGAASSADNAATADGTSTADGDDSDPAEAPADPSRMRLPGIDVDLRAVLHAGQSITAHRPIPAAGRAEVRRRVSDVCDLGKAALIVIETSVADAQGPLWTEHSRIYVRGEGGFGGDSGPARRPVPERSPDISFRVPTRPDQALLYRLNGDFNPLHIDPKFARSAGLPGPILHGLATYGMVTKALTDAVATGRPEAVSEVGAKFSGMVTPGDELTIDIWKVDVAVHAFRARVEATGQTVLDEGVITLR